MATNPKFDETLRRLHELHAKKNSDYAQPANPYSNFEYAASLAARFSRPLDRVFATMLGIKLARIAELTQPGRIPRNEALLDSFLDLANYAAIWASYYYGLQQPDAREAVPEILPKVQPAAASARASGSLAWERTSREAERPQDPREEPGRRG